MLPRQPLGKCLAVGTENTVIKGHVVGVPRDLGPPRGQGLCRDRWEGSPECWGEKRGARGHAADDTWLPFERRAFRAKVWGSAFWSCRWISIFVTKNTWERCIFQNSNAMQNRTLSHLKTSVVGTAEGALDGAGPASDPRLPFLQWAQFVFVEESANVLSAHFLHFLLLTPGDR